ncbi:MAG: hypothetical protein JXX29_07915 [Deltaproteobacteria bacterium]|nr:hypothetical protein [Deltaproteobacteria bacterium]MBN2671584.1 hypothetical protein [Deltaproteobacteria bacterium]
MSTKVTHKATIDESTQGPLVEYLAAQTELSKMKIKKAIGAGGCWIKRSHVKRAKLQRLRKLKYVLTPGDELAFYFDENALTYAGDPPVCLYEGRDYGLWFKPVNMLSGPSRAGEVCAVDYQIAKQTGREQVNVINRLDREASGIVAVGYTRKGSAMLSELWRSGDVEKSYQLEVLGRPEPSKGVFDSKIEGKPARTAYEVVETRTDKKGRETSFVSAVIETGRFHQIRRHFAKAGFPVMGDPRYGKDNGHPLGLRLVSSGVRYRCPIRKKDVSVEVPPDKRLWS